MRWWHAHFDHIEGHALMQRRTGAQVMAMRGDVEAGLKPGTTRRRSAHAAGSRFAYRAG